MGDEAWRRRSFVLALAAASSACRNLRAGPPSQPPPGKTEAPAPAAQPAPPDAITSATVAQAEKLAGVTFTDAERTMMLETLELNLARATKRRAWRPPNALAPATVFDPRLPERPIPARKPAVDPPRATPKLPAADADIAFAPLIHLRHWLRARKISSVRLTELYLQRLDTHNPALQCVVTRTADLADAQARDADRALARGRGGPLLGIPWGAKDLIDTRNIATTWGATPYRERIPAQDATVVERLTRAGAVLVAKLTTGALAYGDIWFAGRTRNPWNVHEGSSGSSAGPAAAVAAGLVGFALGTETLGSIVSPSMRCGTAGLRPTFGRVPRTGTMALCWSLDKIGPITRRAGDAAVVLSEIHGRDPGDPSSLSMPYRYRAGDTVRGLRLGYRPQWFEAETATDHDRAALAAARRLGVALRPIELPDLPYDALLAILFVEAATAFEALTLADRDDELVWQTDRAWPNQFRVARFITAIDYLAAQRLRRHAMGALANVFADVDAIIGPSFADAMLLITNCTGHPSLTIRAGIAPRAPAPDLDGRAPTDTTARPSPHGITLWGRLFDEGTLCRLGTALEDELGVWARRPPVG